MIHASLSQVGWMLAFVTAHAVVAYGLLFAFGYFRRDEARRGDR